MRDISARVVSLSERVCSVHRCAHTDEETSERLRYFKAVPNDGGCIVADGWAVDANLEPDAESYCCCLAAGFVNAVCEL